jgi:TIR domain-containing protein
MPDTQAPIEIFCSYAHEDESLMRELKAHMSGLQHQGRISIWYGRQIKVGTNWAQSIDTHLETASLVLLLISSDFMASHYCYKVEMQRAMQRHQANEVRVIPILVRPVDWQGLPFEQLQVLPTDVKPITSWNNRDEAFVDVAAGIRRALDDLSLLEPSAPHAALPILWNVPYPRNSFFMGRDDVLTRPHTQLQAGQTMALSQPQAISGLGGIVQDPDRARVRLSLPPGVRGSALGLR